MSPNPSKVVLSFLQRVSSSESKPDEYLLERLQSFLKDTEDDWNYILPEELEKQRKKKDFYILDLRKPADYARGHIPGAKTSSGWIS